MKKILFFVVLAVGVYVAYSHFFQNSDEAYAVYEAFADQVAEEVGYVDYEKLGTLVVEGSQAEEFVKAMFIPHTDLDKFPSLKKGGS